MFNQTAYALGANRSCIRDLFEYGCQRAAVVGRENVYDYSLGNPSIPSPKGVNDAIRDILLDTPSLLVHGYTSATGDLEARKAIAKDLNTRYGADTKPEEFFLGRFPPPVRQQIAQHHPRQGQQPRNERGQNRWIHGFLSFLQ